MSLIETRLLQLLENADVRLIETPKLASSFNAVYHSDSRTIFVRWGIDAVTRRCAIAHELGHAYYHDDCTTPSAERRADEWAATQLIDYFDVEQVSEDCGGEPAAMASELGVTPSLLSVWTNLYKTGRIKPTMDCLRPQ